MAYLEHIINDLGQGPFSTVDIIIEMPQGIVLVERSNPPFGYALPGGFVDRGESLEEAAAREAREETNLELTGLRQFHTYSKPGRDPRFDTITTVFIAEGKGEPKAASDAASLTIIPADKLKSMKLAFDHADIIGDYLRSKR
ncbi:MAG: NUDIX hydrolase [Candidatus Omnitrophica bacterium]|nr:NUDIX hydrolase [Candidatus Omnitrophota bacterium]MDD5654468.1 NUDIX hydrolase [Candidatus Omnitrophota bacterium]